MEYVKFGATGLEVSRVCLGCMTYGAPDRGNHTWTLDEEKSRPLIRQAIEAGINFFDTADVYSNGASEEVTGRALKEMRSARQFETTICLKCGVFWTPRPSSCTPPAARSKMRENRSR